MIDTLVLLFSLGMVVFVVVRATVLDRTLPWFPALSRPGARTPPPASRPRRPGAPALGSSAVVSPVPRARPRRARA